MTKADSELCVVQEDLALLVLLSPSLRCGDYTHEPSKQLALSFNYKGLLVCS